MRFRVDRDTLAEAVAWTARALPARPAVPILAGMRLELPEGSTRLRLSSFDYEVSARAAVDAEVEESGALLVSGRLLTEIVRTLPAHPVEVSSDGARALVTCGSARFTLLTLPIEDFPTLPEMPETTGALTADAFASAVRQVTPAASRDDTLPMLTGVYLSFSGDSLSLVATDRYRIAVRDLWWRSEYPDLVISALVPARTLADIARSVVSGSNVGIALPAASMEAGVPNADGEGMIGFENNGRRTTTRLIDGDYVKYESRFPAEFTGHATVSKEAFMEATKRVALVADRGSPLRMSFSLNEVLLEAGSGDDAQAREVLEVEYEGEEMRIAFGPEFFLDGLGAVETETARLSFTTPTKPAVISSVPSEEGARPDFRYLLMPIRAS